jgi:hypothetical protein
MSVDLSQTHLKTTHVIAVVIAIITAGLAIGRAYMGVTWEVRELANKQQEIPTKQDLHTLHNDLSVELAHVASQRVQFYMDHAKLECDLSTRGGHKQNCRLVWPVPEKDD